MFNGPKSQPVNLEELLVLASYPVMKASLVPLLQPLAKIGLEQQVSTVTAKLSFSETAWHIYSTRGLLGFYDGTLVSMLREGFKGSYKGPLQLVANDFSKHFIPQHYAWSPLWRGMVAGGIVGFLDALFAGFIERYKVYRITQNAPVNFPSFCMTVYSLQAGPSFLDRLNGFIIEMYRGLGITMAKQTLMNVSFFTTKSWVDEKAKPYQTNYPVSTATLQAFIPGMSAAIVGAPMDTIKTLSQHVTGSKKDLIRILQSVVATSGWRGLLAGMQCRFVLIGAGYTFNAGFLNMLEKIRRKPTLLTQKEEESDIASLTERLKTLSLSKPAGQEEEPKASFLIAKEAAHFCQFTGSQPLVHEEDKIIKSGFRHKP